MAPVAGNKQKEDPQAQLKSRVDAALKQCVVGVSGLATDAERPVVRLSGGASKAIYRVEASLVTGGKRLLCFRRDAIARPPAEAQGSGLNVGGLQEVTASISIPVEAEAMRVAQGLGVPVPRVLGILPTGDPLGDGFFMEWLEGEALGHRIASSPGFAKARAEGRLGRQCGEAIARLQKAELGPLWGTLPQRPVSGKETVGSLRKGYEMMGVFRPAIDFVLEWLDTNAPSAAETEPPVLVHGDLRNGNILVDPEAGLLAVLDWELCHIGSRYEDMGWLCVRSWRFGQMHLPVGGFSVLEDLCGAYEAAGGPKVDRNAVLWWALLGSVKWAIMCLGIGLGFVADRTRLEHGVVGRRVSESELDCLISIAEMSGGVDLVLGVPRGPPSPQKGDNKNGEVPTDTELVEGVQKYLTDVAVPAITTAGDSRIAFMVRVAANALGIVARGLRDGPSVRAEEATTLPVILNKSEVEEGSEVDSPGLRRRLAQELRNKKLELGRAGLLRHLLRQTALQVSIDQPKYASLVSVQSKL